MAAPEHDVDDPSGLVAKLRALLRRNGTPAATGDGAGLSFRERVFDTPMFFRLWRTQAITSTGDWLAFLAILTLAYRVGAGEGGVPAAGTSIGLVMAARIVPGFFFSAAAGVLVDRMDRKQVMVVTTVMRAVVVGLLPFVDTVLGLVFASLVLEVATLLFGPAKEATVPNLVASDRLAGANSLGLVAAYGTFPVGAILFAASAEVAELLGGMSTFDTLRTSQEAVAFYVACLCYLAAALMVSRLELPENHVRLHEDENVDLGKVFTDLKDGWHFAFLNPVVRGVNLGLATGLIGGGMLVPLGQTFSEQVLGAGPGGYGLFITALGLGVGVGIVTVSARQGSIAKERAFAGSVYGAGLTLLVGASTAALGPALVAVAVMGVFAGRVYVLGFTLLHENVDDELRGRVFAGLYTLVRLCVLLAMAAGPVLAGLLDDLSDRYLGRELELGLRIGVPGVRLTLWLAGSIMLLAAVLSSRSMRPGGEGTADTHPQPEGTAPDRRPSPMTSSEKGSPTA